MKQKLSGLHIGACQKPQTISSELLTVTIPAALIFCALAGLLITAAGLQSALPLFSAGLLFLAIFTAAKHVHKEAMVLPIALVLLIITACLVHAQLLSGFGAAWNTLRGLWAAETGILLPLAETNGTGLWLAAALLGLLLAALSLLLARVPVPASALLMALTVAAALVHGTVWLLVAAGISVLLLAWQKNAVSAVGSLVCGVIVVSIAAICMQTDVMQDFSRNAKDSLHHWRYEKAEEALPEGDLSEPVTQTESTDTILSVTADTAQTLYLRGFVGDTYENGVWSALDAETAAEEKDLFYWLHQSGFYPQSQLATAARLMGNYQSGSVSVQNLTGCSLYRYEPCTVLPERAGLAKNKIRPSAVETTGLRGERGYSYETVSDAQTILPELLDFLQNDTSNGVGTYLQMESAYRAFVYSYALDVPAEFRAQLGAVLDGCCESYGLADSLTKEQAQTAALTFLERCFDGSGDIALPLADTADGTTYQYATVAALALRYYGIPARYVEGYTVKTAEKEPTNVDASAAGAWVEVYQDGIGWLPLALTPGLEDLSAEQTESGIKPVGAGKEGNGDGPRVTEGQEREQDDAEPDSSEDNTPDGGQRTGLLHKPVFWLLLVAGILLLCVLLLLIRHHIVLQRRKKTFENPDRAEAVSSLFSDAARLLSALGLNRRNGSMLALYAPMRERFGEENAEWLQRMVLLNEKALFSSKTVAGAEYEAMQSFRKTALDLLRANTKFLRKLRLKWLDCLY